jgi:hypothetical protein
VAKKKKKLRAEPVAPVVTVTCPNCGASVRADPGDRAACNYCGTDIHVPRIEIEATAEPESEPPAESEPPVRRPPEPLAPGRDDATWRIAMALGVVVVAAIAIVVVTRDPVELPPTTTIPRDPELDGMQQQLECRSSCMEPCTQIKDVHAMVRCHESCEKKCKYVGKGAGSECRARCAKKCASAGDPVVRSACLDGCRSDCPP